MNTDETNQALPEEQPMSLEEMTNAQLVEEVVKLGMPEEDAKKVPNKSVLISMINTLKAKDASNKVQAGTDPVSTPTEDRRVEAQWRAKAKKQWDYWNSQPKTSILVPLSGQEKQGVIKWELDAALGVQVPKHVSGAIQTAIENGAQYVIPKGVYVDVPQPVAKLIQDKYQQTSQAGANIKADRMDPETGKPVSDRL